MKAEKGNALFLILIAVALFAALSYAITTSGRGGGSIDKENASIAAAQIVQYGTALEHAVRKVKLFGGCQNAQLNFENALDSDYDNTGAPTDGSCDIFGTNGGGASFQKMPQGTGDSNGYPMFYALRIQGIGSNNLSFDESREVSLIVPIVSEEICQEINKRLNLPDALAIDRIVDDTNKTLFKYHGDNPANNLIPDDSGNIAGYTGKYSACIQASAVVTEYPRSEGYGYFYYHVLSAGPHGL